MDEPARELEKRWRDSLAHAASHAFEIAHGNPVPDPRRGVRWSIDRRVAVAVGIVVVGCAVVAWIVAMPRDEVPLDLAGPSASFEAHVIVDVAGAVAAPGIVRLPTGSRVADAVSAAGGAQPDAAIDGVNLARVVVDGEQIDIPRVGAETQDPRIDINRASAAELEALPGIGPVLAQRIVGFRTDHGPFATVDDLTGVPGLGVAVLAGLVDLARV